MKKKRAALLYILWMLAIGAGLWWWSPYHGYIPLRFSPESWKDADPTTRGRMLQDLLRRYQLSGMNREQVERLLGPAPYPVGYMGFNPRSSFSYELRIDYDEHGRVEDYGW